MYTAFVRMDQDRSFKSLDVKTAMSFNVTATTLLSALKVAFSEASNTITQSIQKSSKSAKKPTPSLRCAIPLNKLGKKFHSMVLKQTTAFRRNTILSVNQSVAINKTKTFSATPH